MSETHYWSDDVARAFAKPLTGELVEGTLENYERADREAREEITRLYKGLHEIQPTLAELRGPVGVPPRRYQTDTQLSICPKCKREWEPETQETAL